MYIFLGLLCVAVILIVALKKFSKDSTDTHEKIRNETSNKIAQEEAERARRYDEQKALNESSPTMTIHTKLKVTHKIVETDDTPKTAADILQELLDKGREHIKVDAELVFKKPYFKDQCYLRATHYFPDRECVYGKNADGRIVWVDLNTQKEATHPTTGERIPGIRRYLRQNAIL